MTGTGTIRDYAIGMGSYKTAPRGIQVSTAIANSLVSNQSVSAYGAGARLEW